jgi:WD repeat-containing protein 7
MVPGAPAPLTRVGISGDNLLLLYADDRARLWDVKTLEFWRSMNTEKAKELLSQGGWTELSVIVCATYRTRAYFLEQVTS